MSFERVTNIGAHRETIFQREEQLATCAAVLWSSHDQESFQLKYHSQTSFCQQPADAPYGTLSLLLNVPDYWSVDWSGNVLLPCACFPSMLGAILPLLPLAVLGNMSQNLLIYYLYFDFLVLSLHTTLRALEPF